MADLRLKLSPNFTLGELVRSNTAERYEDLKRIQENPPQKIVDNLHYLVTAVLQPVRDHLAFPIRITSGYRSPEVNVKVGGSPRSRHLNGQAADCQLSPRFLTSPSTQAIRDEINARILESTGKPARGDVNPNFYLFAFVVIHLADLDIDQVIHEYGHGYGEPAWIHLAASKAQDKRTLLSIGNYTNNRYLKPSLTEALAYGN